MPWPAASQTAMLGPCESIRTIADVGNPCRPAPRAQTRNLLRFFGSRAAAVGGVAGHVAGHHGLLGAAAGCVVGKHRAAKQDKAAAQQNVNTTAPTTQTVKRTQS